MDGENDIVLACLHKFLIPIPLLLVMFVSTT